MMPRLDQAVIHKYFVQIRRQSEAVWCMTAISMSLMHIQILGKLTPSNKILQSNKQRRQAWLTLQDQLALG